MRNNNIIKRILWASIEDYAGLWELLWEFNNDSAEITEHEIRQATVELLLKQFLELYFCKEPYGEMTKIDSGWKDLLLNDKYWKIPENNAVSIRVSATEIGKKYFETL
ncbi:MAG: hypothetical protein JW795_09030 [Chitinivibrionales bacterium]|nr:hypothetical protein [Chitinivibrionales bacterium]